MAMRKMVTRPKKMMVWTRMDRPLVCMLPNSTTLFLPGSWNSNPGLNSTNSTTAITTGPQSAILISLFTNSAPTHCNSCTSYSLKRSIGKKDKRVCVSFYTRKESNLMAVSVNNKKSCSATTLRRNRYSFSFDTCQRQCGNLLLVFC